MKSYRLKLINEKNQLISFEMNSEEIPRLNESISLYYQEDFYKKVLEQKNGPFAGLTLDELRDNFDNRTYIVNHVNHRPHVNDGKLETKFMVEARKGKKKLFPSNLFR